MLFRVGFVGIVLIGLDQLGKSDLVAVGLEDKYKRPPPHDYPINIEGGVSDFK